MNTPSHNPNHTDDHRTSLDASDRRLERALDTLAQSERDAAPASLESSIYDATIATLRASITSPAEHIHHDAGRHARVIARISPARASQSRFRFAIAAGLGAMVCAGALWLALSGTPSITPSTTPRLADSSRTNNLGEPAISTIDPDAEVDAMFLASSLFTTGLDDEIDSISASAATLGVSLTDPMGTDWSDPLWSGESL